IRDFHVTGVQTCALPILERLLSRAFWRSARAAALAGQGDVRAARAERRRFEADRAAVPPEAQYLINNTAADILALAGGVLDARKIGRASCRGRAAREVED